MKITFVTFLAACALAAATLPSAQANDAFRATLSVADETSVSVGMSAADVLATLGPPSMRARYGTGRGPSWSYPVSGAVPGTRAFYVEFGPDNRVISAQEYSIPAGG
jgi:outer membrane protein assembly factor BamE (lipoprotein component of BamABCDE complex)